MRIRKEITDPLAEEEKKKTRWCAPGSKQLRKTKKIKRTLP
jgi:hypothetical protein